MNTEELLIDYHERIGEIFRQGVSPFRVANQIWRLHAEYEGKLRSLLTKRRADLSKAAEISEPSTNQPENESPA